MQRNLCTWVTTLGQLQFVNDHPPKAELNFGLDKKSGKMMIYPVVSVENVFIFPGTVKEQCIDLAIIAYLYMNSLTLFLRY